MSDAKVVALYSCGYIYRGLGASDVRNRSLTKIALDTLPLKEMKNLDNMIGLDLVYSKHTNVKSAEY